MAENATVISFAAGALDEDEFSTAAALVVAEGKVTTSWLQKRMGIGYNRAARLIEAMEERGIVSAANHVGKREVLSPKGLAIAATLTAALADPDQREKALDIVGMMETTIQAASPGGVRDVIGKKIPMKESAADKQVSLDAFNVTADELRQFIERFETLEAEKKDVTEQQKELMAEAKGRGYDTKVMKKVVALRKRKPDDIAEEETILELYKSALGMA